MKKTISIAFVILALCKVCYCNENQRADWFNYAEQYINADKQMIINTAQKKQTFSEDYNLRLKAESNIRKISLPSTDILAGLLNSKNDRDREVALVLIMLRNVGDDQLMRTILNRYSNKDDFYVKFYSHQALSHLTNDQLVKYQDKLVNIFNAENDETIIISDMPGLIRLPPEKIKPLFVKFLINGGAGLRKASYAYMLQLDNNFIRDVKKSLEDEHAEEALNFLNKMEIENRVRQ